MLCGPGEFSACCETANTCLGGSGWPPPQPPTALSCPLGCTCQVPLCLLAAVCVMLQTQSLGPTGWGRQHAGVESTRDGFSGHNYRLQMVDCIFCGLLLPGGKWSSSQNMRQREVLACDIRATTWGDGGGSQERTGLSGARTFGTVLGARKNVGFRVQGCDATSTSPSGYRIHLLWEEQKSLVYSRFWPLFCHRVGSE